MIHPDIVRCLCMALAALVIGMGAAMFVGRARRIIVPHGTRLNLLGLMLLGMATAGETYRRLGDAYTWRTWVFLTSYVFLGLGMCRLYLHLGYCNPLRRPHKPLAGPAMPPIPQVMKVPSRAARVVA